MSTRILLTSFQTWLPHQVSNSSDDLLGLVAAHNLPSVSLTFLRQLPVDTELASQQAIAQIQALQPDFVVCCGMAERRSQLTLESNAWGRDRQLYTDLNLSLLLNSLKNSKISHDAGKFVCEGLYFRVLSYFETLSRSKSCLFVHVPILTPHNQKEILQDFIQLIANLAQFEDYKHFWGKNATYATTKLTIFNILESKPLKYWLNSMNIFSWIPTPPPLKPRSEPYELKGRLDWGKPGLTIIDTRPLNDYNSERITGAISFPGKELIDRSLMALELTRDIYIYDETDEQTAIVATQLREAGYQNVSELIGGAEAWKAMGYPTEKVSIQAA